MYSQFDRPLPVTIDRTKSLLANANTDLQAMNEKDLVIFLGYSGVGKSTAINYLKSVQAQKKGLNLTYPEEVIPFVKIVDESSEELSTVLPQCVNADEIRLNLAYCDLPGFREGCEKNEQTRDCCDFFTRIAIQASGSVKAVVIVIKYEMLAGSSLGLLKNYIEECEARFVDFYRVRRSVLLLVNNFLPGSKEQNEKKVFEELQSKIKSCKKSLAEKEQELSQARAQISIYEDAFYQTEQFLSSMSDPLQTIFNECARLRRSIRFLRMFDNDQGNIFTFCPTNMSARQNIVKKLKEIVYFGDLFNIYSIPNDCNINRKNYENNYIFYNSKLRYLSANDCDLLLTDTAPQTGNIHWLPIESNFAYVRARRELFYVSRSENTCTVYCVDAEQLRRFDQATNINRLKNNSYKTLTKQELDMVQEIIGHAGGVEEHIVQINQPLAFSAHIKLLRGDKSKKAEEEIILVTLSRTEFIKWLDSNNLKIFANGVISKSDFNLHMNHQYINFFRIINCIATEACIKINKILQLEQTLKLVAEKSEKEVGFVKKLNENRAVLLENRYDCYLYIMPTRPTRFSEYRTSYIFINGELLYVSINKQWELVNINNGTKFLQNLKEIYPHPADTTGRVRLSPQQIQTLITSNGGHVRFGRNELRNILTKHVEEEHLDKKNALMRTIQACSNRIENIQKEQHTYDLTGEELYWEDGMFFERNFAVTKAINVANFFRIAAAGATILSFFAPIVGGPVATSITILDHTCSAASSAHDLVTEIMAINVNESNITENAQFSPRLPIDSDIEAILRVTKNQEFTYDDVVLFTDVRLFKDHGYFSNSKESFNLERSRYSVFFSPNPFYDSTAVVKIFAKKISIPANQQWLTDMAEIIEEISQEKERLQKEYHDENFDIMPEVDQLEQSLCGLHSSTLTVDHILAHFNQCIDKSYDTISNKSNIKKSYTDRLHNLETNFSKEVDMYKLIVKVKTLFNDNNSPKIRELEKLMVSLDIVSPHLISEQRSLIVTKELPHKHRLASLPLGSNKGYVRVHTSLNKHFLFYVDKLRNEINPIDIDSSYLLEHLDKEMNISTADEKKENRARKLVKSEIEKITSISKCKIKNKNAPFLTSFSFS